VMMLRAHGGFPEEAEVYRKSRARDPGLEIQCSGLRANADGGFFTQS